MGNSDEERVERYQRNREALFIRYKDIVGDINRFDVPFEELVRKRWTADEAWSYATFFLGYDFSTPDYPDGTSYLRSLKELHEKREARCGEKALAIYSLMDEKNRLFPFYLTGENGAHIIIAAYHGKFCSLDTSVNPSLGRRDNNYPSIPDLLNEYASFFTHYSLLDIPTLKGNSDVLKGEGIKIVHNPRAFKPILPQ